MEETMVYVEGGTFDMGDVFGEGEENELPVHDVELHGFYISKFEVTVGQFKAFVGETGYRTSAENPENRDEQRRIIGKLSSGKLSQQESRDLYGELLEYSGASRWFTDKPRWGFEPDINWRDPGIEQTEAHPVVCISWDDAIQYCNWASEKAGLPVAYDLESGTLLDEDGDPTTDIAKVKGYRLPTEAEWEYAAREGGRRVRFGTGQDTARSSEINYRADIVDQIYAQKGEYRRGTSPVGNFAPNSLGLHDMSGNAWEWVSDKFSKYSTGLQVNPYVTIGSEQTLRGGRWGGVAFEIRVFHRSGWKRNDRCNNSGFRLARSGG